MVDSEKVMSQGCLYDSVNEVSMKSELQVQGTRLLEPGSRWGSGGAGQAFSLEQRSLL